VDKQNWGDVVLIDPYEKNQVKRTAHARACAAPISLLKWHTQITFVI